MKVNHCFNVTIRFNSSNHQCVSISHNHGPTATQFLKVSCGEGLLTVQFIDKENDVLRELVYNFNHVLEYDCEGRVGQKHAL